MKKSQIGHLVAFCIGIGLFMLCITVISDVPNENLTKSDVVKVSAFWFTMMAGLWITFSPFSAFMNWLESKIRKWVDA